MAPVVYLWGMMYEALQKRGYKYLVDAVNNWDKRRGVLIGYWGRNNNSFKRIQRITDELDVRLRGVLRLIYSCKEQKQGIEEEAKEQFILLECKSYSCRMNPVVTRLAVTREQYRQNIYSCDICGHQLVLKEPIRILMG